jgi:hypothetical protein
LRLEIDSPELDLMSPMFDAWMSVRIPAIHSRKFCSTFVKLEAFDVREFSVMTLFQFHRSDTFPFLMIYIPALPAILSRGNPILVQ